MILATLRRLTLPALLILVLASDAAFSEPAGRKSGRSGSRKAVAKSTHSRSTKAAKSVGRASSHTARGSKKVGRRSGRLSARGRGRRGRPRWRPQLATLSHHQTGIHNFLTDSWARAQTSPRTGPSSEGVYADAPLVRPSNPADRTPSSAPIPQPSAPGLGIDIEPPPNPLVAAFDESLAVRGFNPENQGFIVETMKGEVLAEHNADRPFNPASVVKVATSLTVISRLGPDFRFRTSLYTDGAIDPTTGILHGSLYVVGSGDPAFFYENAMMIAEKLNRSGIREVDGNLVVLGPFYFNFSASREASARVFRSTLESDSWSQEAKNAFPRFLSMRYAEERLNQASGQPIQPVSTLPPSLKISGQTIAEPWVDTGTLRLLAVHTSLQLVRVLKGLNDFSNNWMAKIVGNLVGGPDAVQRFLKTEVGLKDEELNIVTPSGLGSNYISPRGTAHILRKLIIYLGTKGLGLEDLLPVAGMDHGTLERRFTDAFRGSVVAKTGTLSGVSTLAGVAYTRERGPLLFVMFNRGGSPSSFRAAQDETIKKLITLFGGPAPIRYSPNGTPRITDRPDQTPSLTSTK
jgi:D-alanyl-D-alanine carboxypeptidase